MSVSSTRHFCLDSPKNSVAPSVVPNDRRASPTKHQDGIVPERVVQHPGCAAEKDQDGSYSIGDGFVRELHGRKRDNAHRCTVQARDEGINRAWKGVADFRDADSKRICTNCARETFNNERQRKIAGSERPTSTT